MPGCSSYPIHVRAGVGELVGKNEQAQTDHHGRGSKIEKTLHEIYAKHTGHRKAIFPRQQQGPDLRAVRDRLRTSLATKPVPERKALMHALVHEIRVTSRAEIQPIFRFPTPPSANTQVRAQVGSAPPAGIEPAAVRLEGGRSFR